MPTILPTKSLYYSDVNLISNGNGKVNSRSEIPKELNRVFTSPMAAICGEKFIEAASKTGINVCLHRFCNPQYQAYLFNLFLGKTGSLDRIWIDIGLKNGLFELEVLIKECWEMPRNLLIDCAFADIPKLNGYIKELNKTFSYKNLMIGNIHSAGGLESLLNKLDYSTNINYYIRVGIAGGSPCSSSDMAGINRGQITELIECYNYLNSKNINNVFILGDGGVYKPGIFVKALGAGAYGCLLGGYFVKSQEAETHQIGDGTYWGGASDKQQILQTGKQYRTSEGKVFSVDKTEIKPLQILVDDLWGGIASAMSYLGYSNVTDFIGNGVFEIKQNSLPPKNRH